MRKLGWIAASSLATAMAIFLLYQFTAQPGTTATRKSGVEASKVAVTSPANAISLAVLPFANLSSDSEQQFFSDGMTEEITAALAKIPDLSVVARTSAYQFKGENKDMRAVGQALGATHLMEGSVRKAGNRVRITPSLSRATTARISRLIVSTAI
jgi:TolB-like protein